MTSRRCSARRSRPRRRPSRRRPACWRSCARPASSTRAARACTACSRGRVRISPAGRRAGATGRRATPKPITSSHPRGHADEGYGYETMFLLRARGATSRPRRRRDPRSPSRRSGIGARRRRRAGDQGPRTTSVRDVVIGYGSRIGDLSRITVENLDSQAHDVRETAGGGSSPAPSCPLRPRRASPVPAPAVAPEVDHNGRVRRPTYRAFPSSR